MVRDIQPLALSVGVAIACSVGAAAWYFSLCAEKEEKVEGTLSCPCGKVQGKFSAPKSSPVAACHCKDCVEFARWSIVEKKSPVNLASNCGGTHMVQLYKDQFEWVCGCEHVERVRLRDDSPLERLCTTCCGTPIGFSSAHLSAFPLFVIHTELLTYTSSSTFRDLRWRLNVARVPKEERTWEGETRGGAGSPQCVVTEGLAPSFLWKLLSRVAYGMLMGRAQPDPMAKVPAGYTVLGLNVKKG